MARAVAAALPELPGPSGRWSPGGSPAAPPARPAKPEAHDSRLLLSVPKLGVKDTVVGDSSEQAYLDREGIMHPSGTGFPHERGSNTYIAGHAADYDGSRRPNVFRNLKDLRPGDAITLRDAAGETYEYRVYERIVVSPRDYWVTEPVPGKKVVSLQTCFPAPTFDKRLVVRGELVSSPRSLSAFWPQTVAGPRKGCVSRRRGYVGISTCRSLVWGRRPSANPLGRPF